MQTEDRLTVGAHAATWSRTIRLFADSEAGSQTMRAAGGRERERSRTGADDTAGRRRDTSIRPWPNDLEANDRGGSCRRVRCDVIDQTVGPPRGSTTVEVFLSAVQRPLNDHSAGKPNPLEVGPASATSRATRGLSDRPLSGSARGPYPAPLSRVITPHTRGC